METVDGMKDHMGMCAWHEVECPSPGCYTRMQRREVKRHVDESVQEHMDKALFVVKWHVNEMENMGMRCARLVEELNETHKKFNGNVYMDGCGRERVFMQPAISMYKGCHDEFDVRVSVERGRLNSSIQTVKTSEPIHEDPYLCDTLWEIVAPQPVDEKQDDCSK